MDLKTKQSIVESNKLIANFMGAIYYDDNIWKKNIVWQPTTYKKNELWIPYHGICCFSTIDLGNGKILEYHKSYNWLIPVLEKIATIDTVEDPVNPKFRIDIVYGDNSYIMISGYPINTILKHAKSHEGSMKKAIYAAVIEFITEYNKFKK